MANRDETGRVDPAGAPPAGAGGAEAGGTRPVGKGVRKKKRPARRLYTPDEKWTTMEATHSDESWQREESDHRW